MRDVSRAEVQKRLLAACDKAGSQAEFAREIGVTFQSVSLAVNGATPSWRILDALNLERLTVYRVKARNEVPF